MEHSLGALTSAAVAWDQVAILLLPLPLILAANWCEAPPPGGSLPARIAQAIGGLAWLGLGLVAASAFLIAIITLAAAWAARPGPAGHGLFAAAVVMAASGMGAVGFLLRSNRDLLARVIPIDPASPVHATALVLSVVLVGSQLAGQVATDVLAQQARSGVALGPADIVLQEAPFLVAAILGVGLVIRRSPAATIRRLGLVRPSGWQVLLALGAAGLFYAFGTGADQLSHHLTPGLADKVDAANQRLFGRLGDPVGIATIAISAAICEEILFRGAMQPRLGLVWPAIVFAAIHTQYGLSVDAVAVLILALGLGLLRRVANTTSAIICHVTYDTLVGVGVGGPWLVPALVLEAALLLGCLLALYRLARQPAGRRIESGAEP